MIGCIWNYKETEVSIIDPFGIYEVARERGRWRENEREKEME